MIGLEGSAGAGVGTRLMVARLAGWLVGAMLIALLVAGTMGAGKAWAENFVVANDGDGPPSGGSCTTAADDCTLRDAITLANNNGESDTITFNLPPNSTINLTDGDLRVQNDVVGADLRIEGPGADQLTVDGNGNDRVFEIDFTLGLDAEATIEGLTITGGGNTGVGSGILNLGTLTLNNSTVSGNTAGSDGGGINNEGTLTLNNSTVSNNVADGDGGGISNIEDSFTPSPTTLVINNSTVSNNVADDDFDDQDGGGIYNDASATINNSTVSGNRAGRNGGGIFNDDGTMTVRNSTASGNRAGNNSGGIRSLTDRVTSDDPNPSERTTIINSTISGNTAGGDVLKFL